MMLAASERREFAVSAISLGCVVRPIGHAWRHRSQVVAARQAVFDTAFRANPEGFRLRPLANAGIHFPSQMLILQLTDVAP